jgi:flagella basal body P-ring formation protein FlgA
MSRIASLIVLLMFAAVWPAAADTTVEGRVSAALVAAVRQRMGADTEVIVERLEILTAGEITTVNATPDPGARLGGVVRFALTVDGRRAGHADAQLHVVATRARASRFVPRGTTLGDGDLEDVHDEITDGPLRPLPTAADLTGCRSVRDLQAGAPIAAGSVVARLAVRTGQTVTAVMRAFGVEASASMVAADSGNPGSIIRVVNRETRRALRARIVSTEIVEIIHD